jgi:hypothetical protein
MSALLQFIGCVLLLFVGLTVKSSCQKLLQFSRGEPEWGLEVVFNQQTESISRASYRTLCTLSKEYCDGTAKCPIDALRIRKGGVGLSALPGTESKVANSPEQSAELTLFSPPKNRIGLQPPREIGAHLYRVYAVRGWSSLCNCTVTCV